MVKKLIFVLLKILLKNGICYLSEDRKKEGLILGMSVGNNMTLANLKKYENGAKRINKVEEGK